MTVQAGGSRAPASYQFQGSPNFSSPALNFSTVSNAGTFSDRKKVSGPGVA